MIVSTLWHRSKWNWPTAVSQFPFSDLGAATPSKDVHLIFWVHLGTWGLNTSSNLPLVSRMKMLLGDTGWEMRWAFVASKQLKSPSCGALGDS